MDVMGYLSVPQPCSDLLEDVVPSSCLPRGPRFTCGLLGQGADFPLQRHPVCYGHCVLVLAGGVTVRMLHGDTSAVALSAATGLLGAAVAATDLFDEDLQGLELMEASLREGDVLILPPGWWHQTLCTVGPAALALTPFLTQATIPLSLAELSKHGFVIEASREAAPGDALRACLSTAGRSGQLGQGTWPFLLSALTGEEKEAELPFQDRLWKLIKAQPAFASSGAVLPADADTWPPEVLKRFVASGGFLIPQGRTQEPIRRTTILSEWMAMPIPSQGSFSLPDEGQVPLFNGANAQQLAAMEQRVPLLYWSPDRHPHTESSSIPHDAIQAEVARQLDGLKQQLRAEQERAGRAEAELLRIRSQQAGEVEATALQQAQGASNLEGFRRLCVHTWIVQNPGWQVIVLDATSVKGYIEEADLPHCYEELPAAQQSDALRLALLQRYGGVYTDVATICLRPLEEWIWSEITTGPLEKGLGAWYLACFGMDPGSSREYVENWFLAARRGHPLIRAWRELYVEGWKLARTRHDYPTSPLFCDVDLSHISIAEHRDWLLMHVCFKKLIDEDEYLRRLWSEEITLLKADVGALAWMADVDASCPEDSVRRWIFSQDPEWSQAQLDAAPMLKFVGDAAQALQWQPQETLTEQDNCLTQVLKKALPHSPSRREPVGSGQKVVPFMP
eukprot:s1333_g6.t2